LTANVFQSAHQECALVHPLLYGSERMLDAFTPFLENLQACHQTSGHAIKHSFMFVPIDLAEFAFGTLRTKRTISTRGAVSEKPIVYS